MENDKIYIFLDIDGVLNAPNDKIIYEMFEESKLKMFTDFLSLNNFELVITSSRRMYEEDVNIIKNVFKKYASVNILSKIRLHKYRGNEIDYYIKQNNILNFIIFDDVDSGISKIDKLNDKFIHVDYLTGLTEEDINKAKMILEK